MWTKDALNELIHSRLQGYQFIVVANREPFTHRYRPDRRIECIRPASGMVSALDPILRACGGVWAGKIVSAILKFEFAENTAWEPETVCSR